MPTDVDRRAVQRLREQGARLVEVLPVEEYELEHIAGAVNLPLKELDAAAVSAWRRDEPLVVYCNDQQ
jgi:rhodanese-related sulfurtransferase